MGEFKMRKKFILIGIAILFVMLAACHKIDKIEPSPLDTATPAAQAPATGQAAAGGAPAPSGPPASAVFGTNYSGRADYSTVTSRSPCRSASECTFSKYANVPKNAGECACQAACEPFVVTKTEEAVRKESNERLCGPSTWFGPTCTVLPCNFIEYDQFKCVDGFCLGVDLDGR